MTHAYVVNQMGIHLYYLYFNSLLMCEKTMQDGVLEISTVIHMAVFSYKLPYIVGYGLVEMTRLTNPKPARFRKLFDNTAADTLPISHFCWKSTCSHRHVNTVGYAATEKSS